MNDQDRRDIIDALNRENRSAQERILATLESFKNWVMLAWPFPPFRPPALSCPSRPSCLPALSVRPRQFAFSVLGLGPPRNESR